MVAICNWPKPSTVTEVCSFLGFTNHYHCFTDKYAHLARPLNKLTVGDNSHKKNSAVEWNDECEQAFQKLKQLCCETPVLANADYSKPFKLHTDTSELGFGAVLYQSQGEGPDHIIAYASRALSNTESRYPAHHLEFLALKWAVTNRFHKYLYGRKFDVHTGNNAMMYALTTAKLDVTGQHWVASLANYNFKLHCNLGKSNVEDNALLHIQWEHVTLDEAAIKAIIDLGYTSRLAGAVACPSLIPPDVSPLEQSTIGNWKAGMSAAKITTDEWVTMQCQDPVIGKIYELLQSKKLNTFKASEASCPQVKWMLKIRHQFLMWNWLLYCKIKPIHQDQPSLQFVLLTSHQTQAM